MEQKFSQKLRSVSDRINAILDEEDVMGSFILSDGEGMSEFSVGVDRPTWSNVKYLLGDDGAVKGLNIGVYMKSSPEKTQRTVNALVSQSDISVMITNLLLSVENTIRKNVELDEEESAFHPRRDNE